MTRLSQESGDASNNLQAGRDIVVGVSYEAVRQITQDTVELNLYKFRAEAEALIERRVAEMADKFADRMRQEPEASLQNVTDPDVLYAIATAGRDYARTGDEALGDVLVDMLADRCRATSRSLMAVVLNDAIATAGRLTDGEMSILSLAWRVRDCNYTKMNSLDTFKEWLDRELRPFLTTLPTSDPSYWHLQYTGCASIGIVDMDLPDVLQNIYPGLFMRGFTEDQVPADLQEFINDERLFVPSLHDPDKKQVAGMSHAAVRRRAQELDMPEHAETLSRLQRSHVLSLAEVRAWLDASVPWASTLLHRWESTPLRSMRVTAVGTAIAHANYRRLTGDDTPLEIWIHESRDSVRTIVPSV